MCPYSAGLTKNTRHREPCQCEAKLCLARNLCSQCDPETAFVPKNTLSDSCERLQKLNLRRRASSADPRGRIGLTMAPRTGRARANTSLGGREAASVCQC